MKDFTFPFPSPTPTPTPIPFGGKKGRRRRSGAKFVARPLVDRDEDDFGATGTRVTPEMLSPDQTRVFDAIMKWRSAGESPYLTLGGLAGTGKTTLVSVVAHEMDVGRVAFCAFTGKAASVLKTKLRESGVRDPNVSTLHGLIYVPEMHVCGPDCRQRCEQFNATEQRIKEIEAARARGEDVVEPFPHICNQACWNKCHLKNQVTGWKRRPTLEGIQLIVVDEASMLSAVLWDDLRSFDIPILAVGDHGQLPPIGDNPGLMERPDLRLEQIHRQAQGNPIIAMAHHVRTGGHVRTLRLDAKDDRVTFARSVAEAVDMFGGVQAINADPMSIGIICGRNATRTQANQFIRDAMGHRHPKPQKGDVVICLRNDPPIFNGLRGVFQETLNDGEENAWGAIKATFSLPDENLLVTGDVSLHQFGKPKTFANPRDMPGKPNDWKQVGLLLDYGFTLTCHKAQGSQFRQAAVIAGDSFGDRDMRIRWLYTAVTRASEKLILI